MLDPTLLAKVLALPVEERCELAEALWDSLRDDPNAFPLTDAQKRELDRRAAEMDRDPNLGSSWEEVEARLRARIRRPSQG